MERQQRPKGADDFSQKRPLLLNEREPKIVGANKLQVVLPCPLPPLSSRVAQSTTSLKRFSQLSHQQMIESLLSSETFPGLRQHAAALQSSSHENEALDLVFNDPLGLEVDLFHPHSLYDPLPPHNSSASTHASYSSSNGEVTLGGDSSSLPLEDMFLINPQLYFDFVAEREKQAEAAQERKLEMNRELEDQAPISLQPSTTKERFKDESTYEKLKELNEFEEVLKFSKGFQNQEGKQILEVVQFTPQLKDPKGTRLSIANLEVKASHPKDQGSHLFTFEDLRAGETKKPTRLRSFTQMEELRDQESTRFREEAAILALMKQSEDEVQPLALVGAQINGCFIAQPIHHRFKTSTLEKLKNEGQRMLLVPAGSSNLEDWGRKQLELKEGQEKVEEQMGDIQQNDYLSDDMGLAMLHGGPMVEQAPIQSEDEQDF